VLILAGGTPRSGTTWLTNIVQNILRAKNIEFQTVNANSPQEIREAILGHVLGQHRVIHFHAVIPLVARLARTQQATVWYAFRDPGDIVVSQMGLRGVAFGTALKMATAAVNQLNQAIQSPELNLVPYGALLKDPEGHTFQIARSLGFLVSRQEIQEILDACSFDRNKAEVERLDRGEGTFHEQHTATRTIRSNPETLINDRHIQSGKLGRWREELDAEQQRVIEETFAEFYKQLGGF